MDEDRVVQVPSVRVGLLIRQPFLGVSTPGPSASGGPAGTPLVQ